MQISVNLVSEVQFKAECYFCALLIIKLLYINGTVWRGKLGLAVHFPLPTKSVPQATLDKVCTGSFRYEEYNQKLLIIFLRLKSNTSRENFHSCIKD